MAAPRHAHARTQAPADEEFTSERLKNGVGVVAVPSRAPTRPEERVVAIQLWVRAGTSAERRGEFGCAHLLEHMVFKPRVEPGREGRDLATEIEALGGDVNAFTSHDETVFHATVPAPDFERALAVLVNAVVSPTIDADQLAHEREVVCEEIHQYDDEPASRVSQDMAAALHGDDSYARPVLGSADQVRSIDARCLARFHARNYRGENLNLVVAGPVTRARVLRLARRLLGAVPRLPVSARGVLAAPAGRQAAAVHIARRDVLEAHVRIGWHGAPAMQAEAAALDVAAIILGQGESSRLSEGLRRRDRLVADAHASYSLGVRMGVFVVGAEGRASAAEATVVRILEEIDHLRHVPVTREELERARAIIESSLVYRRETVQGQAHAAGYCVSSCREADAERDFFVHLRGLDTARVREVCFERLAPTRAAIELLVPATEVSASDARRIRDRLLRATRGGTPRAARVARRPGRTHDGLWRAELPGGLRIIGRVDRSVAMASAWWVWPGGLRIEAARFAGASHLAAALLTRGTARRGGDAIAREVDGIAATLSGFCGQNSLGLQLECLAADLPLLLERALECVRESSFAEQEFTEERRVTLEDLEAEQDDLGQTAYRRLLAEVYGGHPYGRDVRGTVESLQRLRPGDVARYFRRNYTPDAAVLAIAGDVDLEAVREFLAGRLADGRGRAGIEGRARTRAVPPAPAWPRRPREVILQRRREQAHLVVGYPGLTLGDPRLGALDVLTTVLGGQSGRLFTSLRERRGLVYQVSCSSVEGVDSGHLFVHASASQGKFAEARAAIAEEIHGIVEHGVSESELDRARRWLIGNHALGMQRRSRIASRLAFAETYGLGVDYYLRYPERVAAVTRSGLLEVARALLVDTRAVTSIVRAPLRERNGAPPSKAKVRRS